MSLDLPVFVYGELHFERCSSKSQKLPEDCDSCYLIVASDMFIPLQLCFVKFIYAQMASHMLIYQWVIY